MIEIEEIKQLALFEETIGNVVVGDKVISNTHTKELYVTLIEYKHVLREVMIPISNGLEIARQMQVYWKGIEEELIAYQIKVDKKRSEEQ